KGLEGLLVWEVAPHLSWTSTASYNSSTINDDYQSGTNVVPSKGKDAVDAPRIMGNTGLRYADSQWSGNFGLRHVDKRYFTILNDMAVPAYTVADAGIGYRLPQLGRAKELSLQFNVTNVFDTSYIGPMGTGGFSVSGDLQTLQAGARRLVFLSLGTTF
ncbi:MAG: TonB-dependent receptor, partial [bacterium]